MMLLQHIFERANTIFAKGSNRIYDVRNPDVKSDLTQTHITLIKDDGGAMIWVYPHGDENPNKIQWHYPDGSQKGVLEIAREVCDKELQPDYLGIRYTQDGILIAMSRQSGVWRGDRNRYSLDIRPVVERLIDIGIVTPRTPIYIGNWAQRDDGNAELIGSAAKIMKASRIPNTIVLYHGTSNARAIQIMENGLAPIEGNARVWNKDRKDKTPDHRDDSVYLTASMSQAEYYARKAVNTDRKRLTYDFRSNQEYKIRQLYNTYHTQKLYKNEEGMAETLATVEKLKSANELIRRMSDTVGKVEPVILGITLVRSQYKFLMADDDYLNKMTQNGKTADPTDWRDSLSDFGQVAYRGIIPASEIKKVS